MCMHDAVTSRPYCIAPPLPHHLNTDDCEICCPGLKKIVQNGYSYCVSGNTKPCSARYEGRLVGYQSIVGNAGKRKTGGRAINLTNGDDLTHTHTHARAHAHTHTHTHTHTRTATPVPATASPTRTPTRSLGRTPRGAPRVSCSPPLGTTGTCLSVFFSIPIIMFCHLLGRR